MTMEQDDAKSGIVLAPRVREIVHHEQQADEHQAQSDEHRWKSARLIAEELKDGKPQRQLADEIGKGRAHIRCMADVWLAYGPLGAQELPAFNDAYQQVKVPKKPPGGELAPEPESPKSAEDNYGPAEYLARQERGKEPDVSSETPAPAAEPEGRPLSKREREQAERKAREAAHRACS